MSCGKCHPYRDIGHSGMSKHWWINIWSPSLPPWRCKPSLSGRLNVSVRTLAQKIGLEGSKQLPYQVRIQYSHRPHQDLPEALRWRWGQWLCLRSSPELGTVPPLGALLFAQGRGPGVFLVLQMCAVFPQRPSSPPWSQRLLPRALRVREAEGASMSGFVVLYPK